MFRSLRLLWLGIAFAGAQLGASANADAGAGVEGAITIESIDGQVVIEGRAIASSAGTYDVKLSIVKEGQAGRAATNQGSTLELAAGEQRSAGRATFNLETGDILSVTIEISQAGRVVSRSSSSLHH